MVAIAQIVESFAYGAAKSVCQLCDLLPPDARITVFHGYRQGTDADLRTLSDKVTWRQLPGKGKFWHLENLRFLDDALAADFDTVHGHSSYGGMYAKLLGPRHGLRTLYSPRGYAFLRQDYSAAARTAFRWVERLTAKRCLTIGCGPYEQRLAHQLGGRAVCINNGFQVSPPVPVSDLDRGVLGVGRICRQKGFDTFINVAARLPEVPFVWVGQADDGGLGPADIPANLTVLPYLDHSELLERIERCYMAFLPSRWEGLSRFLIESVCLGKAIVTSKFPGNTDCLDADAQTATDPNKIGWYRNGVSCKTVDQYVDAIEDLWRNPGKVEAMQNASHAYATNHFDIRVIAEKWREVYSQSFDTRH